MEIFEQRKNQLVWRYNGETVVVEPWGQNSVRVRAAMMHEVIDTDYALLPLSEEQNCIIDINGQEASLIHGKIRVVMKQYGWQKRSQISFYNEKGELLLREVDPQGALNKHAHSYKPIIGGDHMITVQFWSDENEKLYGMGQYQQEVMNIKNCSFELAHRNSQASVPFVLSDKGYGFLWHNPAIGRASFCRNLTEWVAESSKQIDYWVTAGDTPSEIVETYAKVCGTVPMMPEYGLGFWQCKLRYYNQEQLLNVAREYKKRNLPIDVIVCDFFHWPKMGDFRFDEEFFPDPEAMTRELKELGIKLMVSVWPQIDVKSENIEEMRKYGYLVKTERGMEVQMGFNDGYVLFYDATNPEAREYVWEKCKKNYYDKGVEFFWLDEAEPEYSVYDYDNYRYHMGPNVQIGNIYPQMYSRSFYEGMVCTREERGETEPESVVNLVRCAWIGSQRYGALVWSGDIHSSYDDFRKQICAGIHMGVAGIPWWTTDIGGFGGGNPEDEDFRELLIRWFQYGTFCPVMRLHGDRLPAEPVYRKSGERMLNSGGDNEVWSYGEEAYTILKKYMLIREKMRPYTRQLMKEAHEKGTPVIRGMFYEFPEDKACYELKDQYMYGSDILVAPVVVKHARKRKVYLPAGAKWLLVSTGNIFLGGQTIEVEAPLNEMPLFLRNEKQKGLFIS